METPLFTVKAENVSPGMVLDLSQFYIDETSTPVGDAEVVSVEDPDGLGSYYGFYVSPESGVVSETYVRVYPWQSLGIVG